MSYQLYPSDLADREWNHLKSMIPAAKIGGRARSIDMRLVLNGVFYVVRSGIPWRYLPREYPPWQTVYGYFRRWRIDGVWERLHERLRATVRQAEGRHRQPSAAILDSQSVKTTRRGGPDRGYDAGKKVNGRKRHILVDTIGLVLLVVVHAASQQDRDGAKLVLQKLQHRYTRSLHAVAIDLGRWRLCWCAYRMGASHTNEEPVAVADRQAQRQQQGVCGAASSVGC